MTDYATEMGVVGSPVFCVFLSGECKFQKMSGSEAMLNEVWDKVNELSKE
jgi:hypothetical protein